MARVEQARTNTVYIIFLIVLTIGIPLLLLLGTMGGDFFLEGLIGAIISFFVLGSYVVYTILLGYRNS